MSEIGYVSLEYAHNYVCEHYAHVPGVVTQWTSMDEYVQRSILLQAFDHLESLPVVGRRKERDQQTNFPRCGELEVAECVKAAQVEEAIGVMQASSNSDGSEYALLRQFGVKSYKIGHLSETSADGAWGASMSSSSSVCSEKASRLLSGYFGGGYRI